MYLILYGSCLPRPGPSGGDCHANPDRVRVQVHSAAANSRNTGKCPAYNGNEMDAMNILEQLNTVTKRPESIIKVRTLGELNVGEVFEFVSHKPLMVGDMIYICSPNLYPYGRAIIINNPSDCLYQAKRTT